MGSALIGVTRARAVAARELLRQLVFAYLSCNRDAHAKNFSVLQDLTDEWRISPLYDAPSSHPYGDFTMALSVDGRRGEDIGRDSFLAFAGALGLRARAVERAIDDLCEKATWISDLDALPFGQRTIQKLRRAVLYRRDRLKARP